MLIRILVCALCLAATAFAQAVSSQEKSIGKEKQGAKTTVMNVSAFAEEKAAESNAAPQGRSHEFRLLATNKTSTMQKEMTEAADAGFHFEATMGGETSFGGSEVVVIMSKESGESKKRFEYKLLATSKTSTMQKEMQQAGDAGFEYKGQSVYSSTFGGKEVVVILERDSEARIKKWEYKLLATKKTSTMQKELNEAGSNGFEFVGVTVGETLVGGKEVVSILRRPLLR